MAQTTTSARDQYLQKYPFFLRPAVLMVILSIEIGVQLWKSVFRHGLPLTDKIATRTALTNYWPPAADPQDTHEVQLHLLPGRHQLLPLRAADHHRAVPDVLLRALGAVRLP